MVLIMAQNQTELPLAAALAVCRYQSMGYFQMDSRAIYGGFRAYPISAGYWQGNKLSR